MAFAVTSKFKAGTVKAAIRILCSEEKPASSNETTLKVFQKKHPKPPADRRPFCDPTGNLRFWSFASRIRRSEEGVTNLSSRITNGRPDGLTPQHLNDLLAAAPDDNFFRLHHSTNQPHARRTLSIRYQQNHISRSALQKERRRSEAYCDWMSNKKTGREMRKPSCYSKKKWKSEASTVFCHKCCRTMK